MTQKSPFLNMPHRKTEVTVNGKKGYIIHNKLTADGPVDEKGVPFPMLDKDGNVVRDSDGDIVPMRGFNDDMSDALHSYRFEITSKVQIEGSSQVVLRYGPISHIAQATPIFTYDHPGLMEVTNTAFTDGTNIFICTDFMRKLYEQEDLSDGKKSGVIMLLIHEIMHKMYRHVDRLQGFSPEIANIAEDYVINAKASKAFPQLKPVPLLVETGYGFKPEEVEKYHSLAEETVAKMLLKQEKQKQNKEQQQQKNGQGQGQSQGQSQGGQGQGQDSSGNKQNQGQGGGKSQNKSKSGQGQGGGQQSSDGSEGSGEQQKENGDGNGNEEFYSPIHHISPEKIAEILEKEGLMETVGQALNIPKKDDVEGHAKRKEDTLSSMGEAIQNSLAEAANCPAGKYPGQHIAEHAEELIGNLRKGKLSWKLGLRKLVLGNGNKGAFSIDNAHNLYFLDEYTLNFHEPYYDGSLVPHRPDDVIACIMDTSGSTSIGDQRQQYASEVLGLIKSSNNRSDSAREVVFVSADTIIRGELQFITEQNVNKILEEGLGISGNGGTDFGTPLKQLIAHPLMKKKKIKTVLYFTDCDGYGPPRSEFAEFLDGGGKIAFFTTPGEYSEEWSKQVSSYAEVYVIEDGTTVDFSKTHIETNTRKNRM